MGLSRLSQRDLVLVLVLIKMVTSSTIELTGDNVCQRVENYTISFKESYMEPVVVNTFDWCLQIPPRCPKSRIEMRERWRIKTEPRQKKVEECCEGYAVKKIERKLTIADNPEVGVCKPQCHICEYGNCVAPNTCECEPGHQGEGCAYECPWGTWGKKCLQVCDCQPNEICNPVDGRCHCPPGWHGLGCQEKCPSGQWGLDCELSCACDHKNYGNNNRLPFTMTELTSKCHHETGSCIDFEEIIIPTVTEIITSSNRKTNTDLSTRSTTVTFVPSSTTKSSTIDRTKDFESDHHVSNVERYSVKANDDDHEDDSPAEESKESPIRWSMPIDGKVDNNPTVQVYTSTERTSIETSPSPIVPEIGKMKTSSIAMRIDTTRFDNYNVEDRVEKIDSKLPKVKKTSTPRPIVAVVHVSGNGSPDHDGPMIMTSLGTEKMPAHAVPMPLDIAALIVIGSIISLGLTTLAVLAIFHIRSKLFETIRLSIYDAEKRDTNNDTNRHSRPEKGTPARISSTVSSNGILACEYETPRCRVPEHQTLTRSRPPSNVETMKQSESTYSNDYRNIRLFNNLQELLEAHYDRPPSTFRPAVLDIEGEHVYDEIPLQSSTTFTTAKSDS